MDRNDPNYKNDPAYRNDNVVDPTAPGYTPVDDVTVPGDGSGTAPENQESGNEALGAGAGVLGGAAVGMAVGGPSGRRHRWRHRWCRWRGRR